MGVTWNFFKSYKIQPSDDYPSDYVISYADCEELGLSYSTSGKIALLLSMFDANIPVYDWQNPPSEKQLELIKPDIVTIACDKAINLLNKVNNPIIDLCNDGKLEPLHDVDDSIVKSNKQIINNLQIIKELSIQGYYITNEID